MMRSLRSHIEVIVCAGICVALAWTTLMMTFPILTGTEQQARVQWAALQVVGFPLISAARPWVRVVADFGVPPFAVLIGLAFLNGALWASAAIVVRAHTRRPGVARADSLPPAA
jgi:apolipoprotein N-acyltransferase